jgi:hypothetical protein
VRKRKARERERERERERKSDTVNGRATTAAVTKIYLAFYRGTLNKDGNCM